MLFFFELSFAAMVVCSTSLELISHTAPKLTSSWSVLSDNLADSEVSFTLSIREAESGIRKIHEVVKLVSDPMSTEYGHFLSSAQIEEITRPSKEDIVTVTSWLDAAGVGYTVSDNRDVHVVASVSQASTLLDTKFQLLNNYETNTQLVRASDFNLPAHIQKAVGAVFGLHGLPLPPASPLTSDTNPADVTPAVIASTYKIAGVTPSGSNKNRQAVAEFQGQYMKASDLTSFFKQFVPNAKAGEDTVYKFVGDADKDIAGVEASLDIQYIMGVAPGVQTDFWLFAGQDFCGDLKNWTATILAADDAPLVHSVSYGWQGNLTQIGCSSDNVKVVDTNFAKLAAKGITIIFASGDSGSGYAPPHAECTPSDYHQNTAYEGTVADVLAASDYQECCAVAGQQGSGGFMYQPPGPPSPGLSCDGSDIGTPDTIYAGSEPKHVFKIPSQKDFCCELAKQEGPYFSSVPTNESGFTECQMWGTEPPQTKSHAGAYSGKAKPTAIGNCTFFSTVAGNKPQTGAVSGVPTLPPTKVVLWPSWPASSPYVTSVGATRFVNQEVGQPEMASVQFGSGGGFSRMFDQTNAQWQVSAVKAYLANHPQDTHFPPNGSFPPNGRATPDVSALGEGYQVVANGQVEAVGGTSASAPAFAGMVALLNEARAQKGKPAMGFLNPFLYQHPDAFRDITLGTNAIGRGTGPLKYGFNATQGWDPVTGLGTPIFDKLLDAALN